MARSKDTISLISADGLRFVIEKKAAMTSTTLKRLITSAGKAIFDFLCLPSHRCQQTKEHIRLFQVQKIMIPWKLCTNYPMWKLITNANTKQSQSDLLWLI